MIKISTLAELGRINRGEVNEIFAELLAQGLQDCANRPHAEKPRTITLKVNLTPKADNTGNLAQIALDHELSLKGPSIRTQTYFGLAMGDKGAAVGLQVAELSPEDPRQKTIEFPDGEQPAPDNGKEGDL